jgi:transposase
MKKYPIELTDEERTELKNLCSKGKQSSRKIRKANILLEADKGISDEKISENLSVGIATVGRVRRRFVEGNLAYALNDFPRGGRPKIFDGIQEASLTALACTRPPKGRCTWTAELLAEQMIYLGVVEMISPESVRLILKKNDLKPWQKQEWCIPKIDAKYVWRMEEILELYGDPLDIRHPVVCFDETPYQLIAESRPSIPRKPGQRLRVDYEYKRMGTANLFMFVQPLGGWRHVKVTQRKTKSDFASCMMELVDVHFPDAEKIHLVLDNLNTHSPSTLYEYVPPQEARRIIKKLDFQYTPKHASWLNMAEIEISVLNKQCLQGRYISSSEILESEVLTWELQRNLMKAKVDWMFAVEDAREKMGHLYPKLLETVSKQVDIAIA